MQQIGVYFRGRAHQHLGWYATDHTRLVFDLAFGEGLAPLFNRVPEVTSDLVVKRPEGIQRGRE